MFTTTGQQKSARGFTLIEVLIALAIVAMALPALVTRVQSVSDNTGYIEEKSYAYWVAQNKLEELMIDYRLKRVFPKTKRHDVIEFAGQEWYWEAESDTTAMEQMYRLEVHVGRDEDNILATLAGFVYEQPRTAEGSR